MGDYHIMATYYVSQDSGNDSNVGSAGAPWKTLSHAFYEAGYTGGGGGHSNAIVISDSATYSVTNDYVSGISDNTSNQIYADTNWLPSPFTIMAESGKKPILDGGHVADFAIAAYDDWTIQGITFRKFGSTRSAHYAIKERTSRRYSTVLDCTIHAITGTAIFLTKASTRIERCTIYDCLEKGIYGYEWFHVKNNIIYDCGSNAIYGGTGGTYADVHAYNVCEHNTVYNCPASGSTSGSRQYAIYTANAKFNIVADASCTIAGMRGNARSTPATTYNCVSGTYDHAGNHTPVNYYRSSTGTGDIETDPLFTDKTGYDFTLSSTSSPCSTSAVGSTAIEDNLSGSREWTFTAAVLGNDSYNTKDMGALEYQNTGVNGVDTLVLNKVNDAS